jgi:predicted DNA-binding transcriptional regulator YafY
LRADRLIAILLLLQNRGKVTSREIAEKLEVSERTIIRDMEALSMAGIPVFAERGSNGGWVLAEGYRTTLTGMKTEEILSLFLSNTSNLLGDLGIHNHFEVALQKLLAASPIMIRRNAEAVRQRIHIDGAGWHQSKESVPYLSIVQEAVWEERKLYMQYRREKDSIERIVHPLGLVAKLNIWYFIAEVDGETRTYRISRLQSARMLEESFQRPPDFNLAQFWEQSTERFKLNLPRYYAQVRMSEKLLPRIAQVRYAQVLWSQPAQNGWVEADIEFQTLESASEIILGFGPLMEVLVPTELRTSVISQAKAILSMYDQTDKEL